MNDITKSTFETGGSGTNSIPKKYKNGLDTMTTITNQFRHALEDTSVDINNAIARINNANKKLSTKTLNV